MTALLGTNGLRKHKLCFYLFPIVFLLFLLACSTAKSAFEEARSRDTIEAYDAFLKNYFDSSYADEANSLREKRYFENIKKAVENAQSTDIYYLAGVIDSYFLEYPSGDYLDQVKSLREKAWYKNATNLNTPSAYQSYLTEYPDGIYASEARLKRERSLFEMAMELDKMNLYDNYLTDYPDSIYTDQVKSMREKKLILKGQGIWRSQGDGSVSTGISERSIQSGSQVIKRKMDVRTSLQ